MQSRPFALTLSFLLLLGLPIACTSTQQTEVPAPQPPETVEATATDPFAEALKYGTQASEQAQTATTSENWSTVAQLWQNAINALEAVPENDENYSVVPEKVEVYQKNLSYANQQLASAQEAEQKALQVSLGGGGLGDGLSIFGDKYGQSDPQYSPPPFQKFKCNRSTSVCEISVLPSDDRAYAVEITLTASNPSQRLSQAEALKQVQYALPKDAQKVKEWQENEDTSAVLYSSEEMKKVFPKDNGNVVAIILHDTNQPNAVFAVNIWSGDTP